MVARAALVRTDADLSSGLGHLQRCLSLAKALRHEGWESAFLLRGDDRAAERVVDAGFGVERLNGARGGGDDDVRAVLTAAARQGCGAVVVDSYDVDAAYLARLRAAGLLVVAIDDLAGHPFPCQLAVNIGTHAHELTYRSSSGDTRFLLGATYALLRPEFWIVPRRITREDVRHVLVTLGGADRFDLMPRLVQMLDTFPGEFSMTAIIGPFFKNRGAIVEMAERVRRTVRLVDAPDAVRDLMLEADLAVSGAGQTLYELACAGCPTVAVQLAANQEAQLRNFVAAGVVRAAGCAGDSDLLTSVADAVERFLDHPADRAAMSAAGQRLVDGQGARRVARAIVESGGCAT